MEERSDQLVVVVGASCLAEQVRRALSRGAHPVAGITSHLRGLRRLLVRGEFNRVDFFISLDDLTLRRHAVSVRQLIDDRVGFGSTVSVIGLLAHQTSSVRGATLGCDLYAVDARHAIRAMRSLQRLRSSDHQRSCWTQPVAAHYSNRLTEGPLSDDAAMVLGSFVASKQCAGAAQKQGG
jgi:hypothetical protein